MTMHISNGAPAVHGVIHTLCGRELINTAGGAECKSCAKIQYKANLRRDLGSTAVANPVAKINEANSEPRHYGYADVAGALMSDSNSGLVEIELRAGDTAVIPGTTKRHFTGVGKVAYWVYADWIYADGGMELSAVEGPTVAYGPQPSNAAPARVAIDASEQVWIEVERPLDILTPAQRATIKAATPEGIPTPAEPVILAQRGSQRVSGGTETPGTDGPVRFRARLGKRKPSAHRRGR